jgi:PleD family two-component response regulator
MPAERGNTVELIAPMADPALLQAKEQGRNRVVVWHPSHVAALAAA